MRLPSCSPVRGSTTPGSGSRWGSTSRPSGPCSRSGGRPGPELVAQTIADAIESDERRLRWPVGVDAEMISAARNPLTYDEFEATMRAYFGIDWQCKRRLNAPALRTGQSAAGSSGRDDRGDSDELTRCELQLSVGGVAGPEGHELVAPQEPEHAARDEGTGAERGQRPHLRRADERDDLVAQRREVRSSAIGLAQLEDYLTRLVEPDGRAVDVGAGGASQVCLFQDLAGRDALDVACGERGADRRRLLCSRRSRGLLRGAVVT